MGENDENLIKAVRHYQESLDKHTETRNDSKLLHYLDRLYKLPIKVVHLEQTGVGRTVNGLRKLGGEVGDSAKSLVAKWKQMVVGEQQEEEEDDEEDGYQTGEEASSDEKEEEVKRDSSSHRKSDKHRTDEKERKKSDKKKEKHKHHKHNGHTSSSKHKSHKRKNDESSSDEETPRKKQKNSSEDEESVKKKQEDKKVKDRQKEKEKEKQKRKEEEKKQELKKAKEEKKSESKSKDSSKSKEKDKKSKLSVNGIASGSGASFAEALGMCEPSSSSKKKKSSSSEKKEKHSTKVDDSVPKLLKEPGELLKEPALEPIDINLASLLPPITPNYRPLGNLISAESQSKKSTSDYEALINIISSKNQRTKVYSGNKMGCGKVPTLFELCIRVLQDNIDALEYTGGVPYSVLKPILEKSTPTQLYSLEHHNPYLIEDTDELWQLHCQKEFRNKHREEFESWREMYLRCLDERDAKLKALTANIKQAQDKSLPVRTTKLAYVDAVVKPPRNILRKQMKNGTAAVVDVRKPTPTAKLATLAVAGEASKVAVPSPAVRSSQVKPKKAPLMLKSISSFKNRFKR